MSQIEVQVVELPAMRVASALGFGTEPEMQASEIISEFVKSAGIKLDPTVRMYGFDNPSPSPGSPNYGYEFWLPVDESVQAIAPVEIKQFAGGTFATTRFIGLSNIGHVWKQLAAWVEDSAYSFGAQYCHGLEENDTPFEKDPEKWTFNLYIPVSSS